MPDTHAIEVVVIGAGISGLSTAHYLKRRGISVQVLERSTRTGGTIETKHVDGFLVDCGPNSGLDTTPLLGEMFSNLGISEALRYAGERTKNRYVVRDGRLRALPMNPFAFMGTRLFSGAAKLRLLREPFVKPGDPGVDESLADFVRRRLGGEMLDYAINPFVSGVYAGAPEALSVRAAFPKLYELEQRYGSLIKGTIKGQRERARRQKEGEKSRSTARLFSFADGMQTITDTMSRDLADDIRTGVDAITIRKTRAGFQIDVASAGREWQLECDAVVLAIPAYAYSQLTFEMDLPIAGPLAQIVYPPVSVVFFGYKKNPSAVPLDGFGFLVPQKEKRNILGTIWNSALFSNRAPEGGASLTTFVGGSRQADHALLPDDRQTDLVRDDLRDLLGISAAPDVVVVRRWEKAIPQYNVGHAAIIEAIESFENQVAGMHVIGNFRGGVAIGDCVRQAHATSERVASTLNR